MDGVGLGCNYACGQLKACLLEYAPLILELLPGVAWLIELWDQLAPIFVPRKRHENRGIVNQY